MDVKGVDLSALKAEAKGPVYRKELAYQGLFRKMKEDGSEPEFELNIDEPQIDHWVNTFQQMKKNGVQVPMPIGHNSEPERRRGTVLDIRKEPNPKRKGGMSLYAYCTFNDEDAAKQFKHSNVSLFMPPRQFDGHGRQYIRPIKHVAITDYPVIPGLDPFQSVAASLDRKYANAFELSLSDEDDEMPLTWVDVANELGIDIPEDADEDVAKSAVQQAYDGDGDQEPDGDEDGSEDFQDDDGDEDVENLGGGEDEDEDEEASFEVPDDEYGADDGGDLVDDEGDDEMRTQGAPPAMAFSADPVPLPQSIVRREAQNRREELLNLVRQRKIAPAVAKVLEKKYCTDEHVGVALSLEPSLGCAGDDFDDVVAALSLNPENHVAVTGHRTGPQNHSAQKSPIVQEAERRAGLNKR